jgi:hypothetical protein
MAPNVFHFPFYLSIPKTIEKDRQKPDLFAPELLPSPSDELALERPILGAALRGTPSRLAKRGITLSS